MVFESDCLETKFQTITSSSQFEKVIVQKSIAELWTIISNQMIKYQLPIRTPLLNQKQCGMVSTKKELEEAIPTGFCWLTRRKPGFCPLLMSVSMNSWLYLSSSLWGIPVSGKKKMSTNTNLKRTDLKNVLL